MVRKTGIIKSVILIIVLLGCLYSFSKNLYTPAPEIKKNDESTIKYEMVDADYEIFFIRQAQSNKNKTLKTAGHGSMFLTKPNKNVSSGAIGPMIMYPAIYYKYSRRFPPNTALLQFRANNNLSIRQDWFCKSKNSKGDELVSSTYPEASYLINKECYFHTFYAKCTTVREPTEILFIPSVGSVNLPITLPNKENLPVVTCGSPVFFGERWQQAVVAIEFLNFFGVNRQVYYYISAGEGFYELLRAYEELKMIDLILWTVADISEIESNKNLYMRDQIGAVNDCLNRYRESADYIIIHDMDDIIFLPQGKDYYNTFHNYFVTRPNTAFIHYYSYLASLRSESKFQNFNLDKVLDSVKIGAIRTWGKSVLNTSLIESTWIHFPHFFDGDLSPLEIRIKEGFLLHTRTWKVKGEEIYKAKVFPFGNRNPYYPYLNRLLSIEQIEKIVNNYESRLNTFKSNPIIANLESSLHYYAIFDRCTKKMGDHRFAVKGCRTAYACEVPTVENFKCVQTRQKFNKHLENDKTSIYIPEGPPVLEIQENGCTVD